MSAKIIDSVSTARGSEKSARARALEREGSAARRVLARAEAQRRTEQEDWVAIKAREQLRAMGLWKGDE